jgi:hypothetical protein
LHFWKLNISPAGESIKVFEATATAPELLETKILIFFNKLDLAGGDDLGVKIRVFLERSGANLKDRVFHIQCCCALTGEGLHEGFRWLATVL